MKFASLPILMVDLRILRIKNSLWSIEKYQKILYRKSMLTKGDLSAISGIVKEEARSVKEDLRGEIKSVEERFNSIIAKVQESVDTVQEVVVKHYGKSNQRVTNPEEELYYSKN